MLDWQDLPGGSRVQHGLACLQHGTLHGDTLLVLSAATRLRGLGLHLAAAPAAWAHQEAHLMLYAWLQRQHGAAAHQQYNAMLRELDSFIAALEAQQGRTHV